MNPRIRISGIAAALAISSASTADVVTDWNDAALEIVRSTPLNPLLATRTLAIVHTAIFDAVNGIDPRYQEYFVRRPGPADASGESAAAYAAHRVLSTLYPDRTEYFDDVLGKSLQGVRPGPARLEGRLWGVYVGSRILALREDDNWDLVVPYTPSGELGRWQPTPPSYAPALSPNWALVTPWAIASSSQFRLDPPPALDTAAFAEAYNEVKSLGRAGSDARTEEQTLIAYFWENGGGSVTPAGHWQIIAQDAALAAGYDLLDNARLFALLSIAQADALISSWDTKYEYDFVRPVSSIQLEGDVDGNPDTQADPGWLSELPTPPFPSYASGHSTLSAASADVLERTFGSHYAFCSTSPDPERWPDLLPGVVRCWRSFGRAAEEAGMSRVYGGIHWQFDNVRALAAGQELGAYVYAHVLRPR
jgi:hypothetical protein